MASEYSQSFDSSGPIVNCLRAIRAKCIGPASACFMGYVEMLHARKTEIKCGDGAIRLYFTQIASAKQTVCDGKW